MNLSRTERWVLAQQYQILEALYPGSAGDFRSSREVLERGYELEYEWICEHIYADLHAMSADECQEVLDIMDMFSFLKRGVEAVAQDSDLTGKDVAFPGFDGNNETKQLGYSHHLRSEGKFAELEEGDDLNSHLPVLEQYRRMLPAWNASEDPHSLTLDDIRRIISAARSAA